MGTQPVQAFNLQCYAGGGGNHPADWIDAISKAGPGTGVTDAAAFVRPGLAVSGSQSQPQYPPQQMTKYLKELPVSGAWIWNTEEAEAAGTNTLEQYSEAISTGLG